MSYCNSGHGKLGIGGLVWYQASISTKYFVRVVLRYRYQVLSNLPSLPNILYHFYYNFYVDGGYFFTFRWSGLDGTVHFFKIWFVASLFFFLVIFLLPVLHVKCHLNIGLFFSS